MLKRAERWKVTLGLEEEETIRWYSNTIERKQNLAHLVTRNGSREREKTNTHLNDAEGQYAI